MSQTRTRKRPAPGTSPVQTVPFKAPSNQNTTNIKQNGATRPMAANQNFQWPQQHQTGYSDPASNYSSAPYNGTAQSPGLPTTPSGQLATRPSGQNIVSRSNHNDTSSENWPVLADGTRQPATGALLGQNDDLDQRADTARRETQAKRKQIPPFVQKLSSFLDEDRNTDLIRWSDKGDSFVVVDEDEFARKLIPELFKHKNYASFVRQLNMYGFHKKVGLSDNSMRASERKDKSPSEYYHPYFQRGRSNLLWLIQKPKNPQGKVIGKGGTRSKQDDGNMDDEVEEPYDIDSPASMNRGQEVGGAQRNSRQPLMIGDSNRGSSGGAATPSQDQMAAIHQELAEVRKNQKMISEVLQQIARENERRAQAYKSLHDRHESSINAILTFLATVYNRSLSEGQPPQNFGNVLAGAFPQDAQQPGNIVDMGDYNEQNSNQNQPLFKRQTLLLKAPPSGNDTSAPTPPSQSQSYLSPNNLQQNPYYNHQSPATHSPAVQELFSPAVSNRSSQSPRTGPSNNENTSEQLPEADIMSMINSHNAENNFTPGTRMDFPEALSHLQSADGKSPLTPNQRHDVLQLMAGSSADNANNNNALTTPNPPDVPDPGQFDMTRDQLEFLGNAIKDQGQKVGNLTQSLAPLSPSGSIPGMRGDGQYNNSDLLDFDSIFNSGDYFNDTGAGDFNFDCNNIIPDLDLGTGATGEGDEAFTNINGFDGAADQRSDRGSGVETLGSSDAPSPAVTVENVPEEQKHREYGRGKRRKKN